MKKINYRVIYGPYTLMGIIAIGFAYAVARFFWTHVCCHLFNL